MSLESFNKKLQNLKNLKQNFPKIAGVEAEAFFKERFVEKNWKDVAVKKWQPRKRPSRKGSLMIVSGRLKRSIRRLQTGDTWVIVGTDAPYARVHNTGGIVYVRPHTRTSKLGKRYQVRSYGYRLPKRQFMGNSAELRKRISKIMTEKIRFAIN